MPKPARTLEDRYWSRVRIPENKDECWMWTGAKSLKSSSSYGHIRASKPSRRVLLAHRVALFLYTGDEGAGRDCCHSDVCTTTLCVNPRHLRYDTKRANTADNDRRYGRVNGKFGTRKGGQER